MKAPSATWSCYLEEGLRAVPEVVVAFAKDDGTTVELRIFVAPYNDDVIDRILDIEDKFAQQLNGTRFVFDVLAASKKDDFSEQQRDSIQVYPSKR